MVRSDLGSPARLGASTPAPSARVRGWLTRHAAEVAAVALASLWFLWLGYGQTLWPTHITWMLRYDWAAALWGFSFFRNAPLTWPLGSAPDLFAPFGTSVGFTDACPWAALLFRLLSPILPVDFQYFGLWFWLCYALQAVVGVRIAALYTDDKPRQALAGGLFALTPLLPARRAHAALCALFFVTAGIYLHLKPVATRRQGLRLMKIAVALLAWAAGTHGYLSLMLLALVLALCARLTFVVRVFGIRELVLSAIASVGVSVAVYLLFGYIGWKPTELGAEGFGLFSADLLTLFNPQEWSRFIPAAGFQPRQWEGFGYLGVGVFFLLLVRLGLWIARRRVPLNELLAQWPLCCVLIVFSLYALSDHVTLRGVEVLNLGWLYRDLAGITSVFRSSGRFVWPLHLTLLALAVSAAAALPGRWLGRGVLLAAVLLQALELNRAPITFAPLPLALPPDRAWATTGAHYRHLVLLPIHLLWVCRYDEPLVHQLSYLAYRQKLSFNSGNIMRMQPGVAALCERGLGEGEPLAADTIYVIDPVLRPQFAARGATCGVIDGLLTCVAPGRETPLVEALRRRPG